MKAFNKLKKRILIITGGFLILALGATYLFYRFNKSLYTICGTEIPPGCATEMPQLSESAKQGRSLFYINCAACHQVSRNMTGPPLESMLNTKKFPYPNYIYDFVTNEDSLLNTNKYRAEYINEEYHSEFDHRFKISTVEFNNLLDYVSERSSIPNETPIMSKGYALGKDLFNRDCHMCHNEQGLINTPYMQKVLENVGVDYFKRFITNQDSLVKSKDIYAVRVKEEFGNMGNSHNLEYSEDEINGLIEYIRDK